MPARTDGAVVVVGSLHYDIMVNAPHRPQKGETVAGDAWQPKFGGKGGNQAVAAARAGAPTRIIGAVGDDSFGEFLLRGLDAASVDRSGVAVIEGIGSGMSVAIVEAEGDYGAVIVSGANLCIPEAMVAREATWVDARILVLQNEVTEALNVTAARAARRAGALVCLNAAPARPLEGDLATLVDILVVNAVEAEMLSGVTVDSLEAARSAAAALSTPAMTVIVTAGAAGVAAAAQDGDLALPAVPVTVVSTHGAGDTFVGVLAAAIAAGDPLVDALAEANVAAAVHVSSK